MTRACLDMCGVRDMNEEEDISILGQSNVLCKLMTLEALYINQLKPSLNRKMNIKKSAYLETIDLSIASFFSPLSPDYDTPCIVI